ncbi:hypothetical protein [uncultured Xanthomonas sp.]|uniref:hypothetical protein n=1 Tax=uncultured Xanthomonas sp. TaxID=152831 RepID=UPI0025FAF27F|nr:hypothetical protein [uncultured Xanthomonas sp.]
MRLWSSAKNRARQAGVPFDLEPADVVIPERCPVLDIPLSTECGKRSEGTASIDRIVPSLGYVKGNVVVTSWRANRLKNDASLDELRRLFEFYAAWPATH